MAFSKSKQQSLSMLIIFIFFCTHFDSSIVGFSLKRLECLKVNPYEFVVSLKTVEDVLHDVTSILHFELNKINGVDNFLFSNAISTCLDLLDMSMEELSWCVSAIDSLKEKYNGTGNLGYDLRTWLSAIHATDTCMDELKGISVNMSDKISTKIDQVYSLINDLLTKVEMVHMNVSDHLTNQSQFPSWVDPREKKLLQTNAIHIFDVVVATDGSGNFTKVMDAVHAAPDCSMKHYVILIKKGVYMENVEVNKNNIMMVGEGMEGTIITGNLSHGKNNLTTYYTATFAVKGTRFIARDISFKNTAGPIGYQAVALRSNSDCSVFYRCGIFGYQDSLYAFSLHQFYRECKISGTVDFIFGSAIAVFQNCHILVKKGLPKQSNTITAQGGYYNGHPTGFSIQFCNISADFDLLPSINSTRTFLGRPWKPYSTTIFMQSYISNVLSPKGWLKWNKSQYLDTLYYAEYKNYGPGAGTQNRVKWLRYHVLNDSKQAINFTVAHFLFGNQWLPSTGVSFTPEFGNVI